MMIKWKRSLPEIENGRTKGGNSSTSVEKDFLKDPKRVPWIQSLKSRLQFLRISIDVMKNSECFFISFQSEEKAVLIPFLQMWRK